MTTFLSRLSSQVSAKSWQREPQLCSCGAPMFQVFVPSSLHAIGDLICSECEQRARAEQITHMKTATLHNLYKRPGQLAQSIHHRMMEEIARLLAPSLPSPKPITQPLPARDIEYSNTSPRIEVARIADIPTGRLNPIPPLPETRAELFQNVPTLEESLILWPYDEDEDITEIRERKPRMATTTQEIPAFHAEVLLADLARGPERVTGEHEPVKHWML